MLLLKLFVCLLFVYLFISLDGKPMRLEAMSFSCCSSLYTEYAAVTLWCIVDTGLTLC